MSRLPGAARRLVRDRPRMVALGLLAVTAVAASGLQTTSAIVLQQTLDENWRGTYDILVTQAGKDPVASGLLRSDALVDATAGRLSLRDLDLIRSLPGVEVAAPIAQVTFASADLVGDPVLWLPVPVRPDASLESPQAFRVTVASATNDGVTPRALATQTVLAFAYQPSYSQIVFDTNGAPLVGPDGRTVYATTDLADSPRLLSGDARVTFSGGAYDAASGTIPLGLSVAPRPAATVALVDPVAERALLGDAGAFLDPLLDNPLGVVVLDRAPSPLRLTVTVEEFDDVTPGVAGAEAVEQAQTTGFLQNGQIAPTIAPDAATTVVGEYELDGTPLLAPFADDTLVLGDLDPELAVDPAGGQGTGAPRSILGARYTIPEDREGAVLVPRGYASYGQYAEGPLRTALPGAVTEYSKLFGAVGVSSRKAPQLSVVGSYSAEQLRALVGETSFMPLGAYDVVTPRLTTGQKLATSLTGFGVPGTNDMAVGSLAILDGLDVERPISAIRIRVAGIDAYTPDAQQKLLAAASGLESLGFEATIVAGSSPQQLPVLVSGYALPATDASGAQLIGDLGTIEQEWSRLGAVTEADIAVSATSIALLAVCVLAVGILLAVVQLGSVPARRATAGVLRELGWRRRRIVRWFAAEEAVGLGVVALAGAAAVALTTVPLVAAVSVGASLVLVVATSVAGVLLGGLSRPPAAESKPGRSPRRLRYGAGAPTQPAARVTGPISFGLRQARTSLGGSVTLGLAVAVTTISVAVAVTAFAQGRALAGPSALGAVASGTAGIPQGVLAAVSLTAGVVLAVLSRRMNLALRREQWAGVRAMGWSRADVSRAHLAELAVSAGIGLVVGLVVDIGIAVLAR